MDKKNGGIKSEIISLAKEVKGTRNRFVQFVQQTIIDKGYEDLLLDSEFVKKLEEINDGFKYAVVFFQDPIEFNIREYFLDKDGNLIIGEDELDEIPIGRTARYEFAKMIEKEGNIDIAKRIYRSIIDQGEDSVAKFIDRYKEHEAVKEEDIRVSTYYKSKYSYYMCKVKNGEKLSEEEKEEVNRLIKDDAKRIRELLDEGADIKFVISILGEETTIEKLEREILPNIKTNDQRGYREKTKAKDPKSKVMTPKERLELYKSLGDIQIVTLGKKELEGYVLFTYDNLTIAERFFYINREKEMVEPISHGATYFVHNAAKIDLERISKNELFKAKNRVKENREGEKLIDIAVHKEEGPKVKRPYAQRVKDKYKAMDGIEIDAKTGEIIKKAKRSRTNKKSIPRKTENELTSETEKEEIQHQEEPVSPAERTEEHTFSSEESEVPVERVSSTEENEEPEERVSSTEETQGQKEPIDEDQISEETTEEVSGNNLEDDTNPTYSSKVIEMINITEQISQIDVEIENLNAEMKELQQLEEELNKEIENTRTEIGTRIKKDLSKKDALETISLAIKTLEDRKRKLDSIRDKKREIAKRNEEQKQSRKELEEKFYDIMNGEGR